MKAIINGLMYDTTSSTNLYVGTNEALYKTNNNSYFRTTPEGFIPMTVNEVKDYLGAKDADAYINEFGPVQNA